MKIIKVIAVLLSISIVSLIVQSCFCTKYPPGKYSLLSFSVSPLDSERIIRVIGGTLYTGETEPYPFRTDFGVRISFQYKIDSTIVTKHEPVKSLFIQSAYALITCPGPIFYPIDSITSIQVFSDKDFGETHLAGADISEFFKIREWNGQTPFPWLTSFEDYLKRPATILDGSIFIYFRCLITATDVEAGEHNFRFVVRLSDERVLEQSVKGVLE